MGELGIRFINKVITDCGKRISEYINRIDNIDEGNFALLLILLTQTIYAKYYTAGAIRGTSCIITPKDLNKVMTKYYRTATDVILLRNLICHQYGSDKMHRSFIDMRNRSEELNSFIKYLLKQDDPLQAAINKMNGI